MEHECPKSNVKMKMTKEDGVMGGGGGKLRPHKAKTARSPQPQTRLNHQQTEEESGK